MIVRTTSPTTTIHINRLIPAPRFPFAPTADLSQATIPDPEPDPRRSRVCSPKYPPPSSIPGEGGSSGVWGLDVSSCEPEAESVQEAFSDRLSDACE